MSNPGFFSFDPSGAPISVTNPLPVTSTSAATAAAPVITSNSDPANRWYYAGVTGGIVDTADVAIKTAAGASVRNYLTTLQAYNGAAAVATEFVVKDGSTIIWRGYLAAVSGKAEAVFDPPLRSTANAALNVACITTASAVRVSAQGYTGP